jgi:hypothetical protein
MSQIETKELLSEIAKRHGFRLDSDDPAIAIVSLNQLVLEKSMQELCDRVGTAIGNIESTAKKAETRAVAYIAQEVKQCVSTIRAELQKDIDAARLKARETLEELNSAHREEAMEKWVTVGIIGAVILIALAFWAGALAFSSPQEVKPTQRAPKSKQVFACTAVPEARSRFR